MNPYLDISPEVREALAAKKAIVALESTIIAHGMPYPQNVETAGKVESIIRKQGAVPATIAVLNGRLKAGLSAQEVSDLGKAGAQVAKVSRRDLARMVVEKQHGATTVASTMIIAAMAGIQVFATGGLRRPARTRPHKRSRRYRRRQSHSRSGSYPGISRNLRRSGNRLSDR